MTMTKFKFINLSRNERERNKNTVETTVTEVMIFELKELLINAKMLLTLMNEMIRSVVKFKLLNSTQIEFQCWVELREVNSTQSSWVRLSIQLDQLDELTWTQLQIYFLSNSLSKWSNFLSNFLSNSLSCFLSYFSSYFSLYFLSYFHHIFHYVSHFIFYHVLYQIFYQIDCKIDCKKKNWKKREKVYYF